MTTFCWFPPLRLSTRVLMLGVRMSISSLYFLTSSATIRRLINPRRFRENLRKEEMAMFSLTDMGMIRPSFLRSRGM